MDNARYRRCAGAAVFLCAAIATLATPAAEAGAGLLLTGYGAQSAAMGGVDNAVVSDTTALLHNPAGLAQLQTRALDVYIEPYYTLDNAHSDAYNAKTDIDNRFGAVSGIGYAQPFLDGRLVAGIGLFAQGGTGWVYEDLQTQFGTRDEASSIFGVIQLTPGFAWRASDQLRFGATLGISYGQARQKLFPNTSVLLSAASEGGEGGAFFGTRYDGGQALGFNGKLGLQYEPSERWTLSLTYASKIPLDIENGELTVNYDAIGLGRVVYRDADQSGLAFAGEVGLGAAYRLTPRWLLAAEFIWMDQSNALQTTRLVARDPDRADVPQEIVAEQDLDVKDQTVTAIAVEHQYDEKTVWRAGYSFSKTPIARQALAPTLALVTKHLVSAGYARQLNANWSFASAIEYQLPNGERYTNPLQPFGADARESNEAVLLTLMLSRRW